jgi:hypothetical protein
MNTTLQNRDDMARNAAWYIQDAKYSREELWHCKATIRVMVCIIAAMALCLAVSMAVSLNLVARGGA